MKSTKTINKSKMTQTIPAPAKRASSPAKAPEPMTKPARATAPVAATVSAPKAGRIKTPEPKPSRAAASESRSPITPEEIARRAYAIWEAQGRPAGKEKEHWLQAETQLKTTQSFSE